MPDVLCAVPQPGAAGEGVRRVDHISGGRFEPGFGAGWHAPEFRAHGYDFPDVGVRFDMLTEGFEIITSMLSDADTTTFSGEHYRTDAVTCVPGPFGGGIPLWTGGTGTTRTPRNAAKYCAGWNVPYVGPAEFRQLNDRLDAACEAIGRDPASLQRSVNLAFHIGATPADATAELDRITAQWGPEMAERVTAGALTGTPDQALERIAEYRAAGADLVNIALRLPVDTDALDAYLTDVVPAARTIA
ncbi:MAG: LLM class flavin-dependent oxidoreductase [Ilumatobacteraceae bacterium]